MGDFALSLVNVFFYPIKYKKSFFFMEMNSQKVFSFPLLQLFRIDRLRMLYGFKNLKFTFDFQWKLVL